MTIIVCVDDRMGIAFNKRRQSRDRIVCQNITQTVAGSHIGMDEKSVKLFDDMDINIVTGEDALKCDNYFLEFDQAYIEGANIDKLIIYRWNRHYPSDRYFDIELDAFSLIETTEFPGSSHELITKEVYVK